MDQDQNLEDVNDVVEEIEVEAKMEDDEQEGDEQEVDLNLLNPDLEEEFGDWAEQV